MTMKNQTHEELCIARRVGLIADAVDKVYGEIKQLSASTDYDRARLEKILEQINKHINEQKNSKTKTLPARTARGQKLQDLAKKSQDAQVLIDRNETVKAINYWLSIAAPPLKKHYDTPLIIGILMESMKEYRNKLLKEAGK